MRCHDGLSLARGIHVIRVSNCSHYTYYTPRIDAAYRVNVVGVLSFVGGGNKMELFIGYKDSTLSSCGVHCRGSLGVSSLLYTRRDRVTTTMRGLVRVGSNLGFGVASLGHQLVTRGIGNFITRDSVATRFRSNVSVGRLRLCTSTLRGGANNVETMFDTTSGKCCFTVINSRTPLTSLFGHFGKDLGIGNNNEKDVIRNTIFTRGDSVVGDLLL